MTSQEIIVLVVCIIALVAFALVITILYHHYVKSSITQVENGSKDIELIDKIVYENQPKVQKRQKGWNITKNIIYYLVLVILIPIFAFGIYSRVSSGVASFGNYTVLVVGSGSMSEKNEANTYLEINHLDNQLQTYDMVVMKKVDESEISLYDIIAFKNNEGQIIIHRIVGNNTVRNGVRLYETRGDANNVSDSYLVSYEDIIGVYNGQRVPGLGMFITFFQSWAGIVTIIAVMYTMIIIAAFNHQYDNAVYQRELILDQHFDIDNMNLDTYKDMEIKMGEKIYYNGETYEYTPDMKFSRRKMTEEEKEEFKTLQEASESENAKQNKKKEKK